MNEKKIQDKHSERSAYRKKLIEHLFTGELMKLSWLDDDDDCLLEVAKPEVNDSGYDIIAETNHVVRHIKLNTSKKGSSPPQVHLKLEDKPSGCVVWIYFKEESQSLELGPYYFCGGQPGEPLPGISGAKVARHEKFSGDGHKAERPNKRKLKKENFTRHETMEEIYSALFVKKIHEPSKSHMGTK